MAEDVVTPATTEAGPPQIASADNGTVKLESFAGDQAAVDSALGITPAQTPVQETLEPTSEALGDSVTSEPTSQDKPLPTVQSGDGASVRDRIGRFTKVNRILGQEVEALKAQVSALTQPIEQEQAPAPELADFGEDTQAYVQAVARWGAKQEFQDQSAVRTEQAATARNTAEQAHIASSWTADIAEVQAEHEDFGVVIAAAQAAAPVDTPGIAAMMATLQEMPQGAEVFYALAKKDPKELQRISTLDAREQTTELVLASRALHAAPAATEAAPTSEPQAQAPTTPDTPIPPVQPSGGGQEQVTLNEHSSHEDYLRWRQREVPP